MPFGQFIPHPLTPSGVRMYAPAASGVYGISNSREWIYVAEADNIKGALLEHLQDPLSPVMKKEPTGFVCELSDGAMRQARSSRLIQEYSPACNRHVSRDHDARK